MALVHAARCRLLRNTPVKQAASRAVQPRPAAAVGSVLYWMSREQRVQDNWALLKALEVARESSCPLAVVFCMSRGFPGATYRAFDFMLHGLSELEERCAALKIPFFLLDGEPPAVLPKFAADVACRTLVTDFSPMPIKKIWLRGLLAGADDDSVAAKPLPAHVTRVIEVDAHNVVPVWSASSEQELFASRIRPKITSQLSTFLTDFPQVTPALVKEYMTVPWPKEYPQPPAVGATIRAFRKVLDVDRSVAPVTWIAPGERAALASATAFTSSAAKMANYAEHRNEPNARAQSDISPYLHFGHVAPQRVAFLCESHKATFSDATARKGADDFFEQLVIRRELFDNFLHYSSLTPIWPEWAVESLRKHERDPREYLYTLEQFEGRETHDELWNAAQLEMATMGKMHAFMRIYWAKKILEWSPNADTAYKIALHLNDKYSLDGRDPNGNGSVAWCIFGATDRPFAPERPVYGVVRYISYSGCKGKFHIPTYIERVKREAAEETVRRIKGAAAGQTKKKTTSNGNSGSCCTSCGAVATQQSFDDDNFYCNECIAKSMPSSQTAPHQPQQGSARTKPVKQKRVPASHVCFTCGASATEQDVGDKNYYCDACFEKWESAAAV